MKDSCASHATNNDRHIASDPDLEGLLQALPIHGNVKISHV
jgi:hypothetical protein